MNALKVRRAIEKRERQERIRREAARVWQRECEKSSEEFDERCRINAMLHVFHVFCILHSDFGFGAARLRKVYEAIIREDRSFKAGRADGVAWSKVINYLEGIGFAVWSEKERKYLEWVIQRDYEDGSVKHFDDDDQYDDCPCEGIFGGKDDEAKDTQDM